ncbi:MAG: hypothetical protein MJZ67_03020 [Bacteroidales bacterium]|nr:hypothetical protein [Bacteroidales bacterium]
MAKNDNFKSLDSLESVQKVINEASAAMKEPERTIATSDIPEVLGAVGGAVIGGAGGFAALYFGGSVVGLSAAGITSGLAAAGSIVGGGMVAGIGVLAAPVAVLGCVGYAVIHNSKEKKLKEEKHRLYNLALQKQQAIINMLQNRSKLSQERISYLTNLNELLRRAIVDLQADINR